MQYQLNISIDQAGVQQINNNAQYVTMVKNVTANPLSTGNLQVAWVTFAPFMNNQVSWIQNYYLYATTTQVQAGATIVMTSQTPAPAQLGPIYDFSKGVFTTTTQGSPQTYNVQNDQGQTLTFGLAQQASVNGANVFAPLNATAVGNTQQATFTPIETVSIYLSSYSNNGVVISQVAGSSLVVQLTSQQPVANIGFNNAQNSFFLISQTAASRARSFANVALAPAPDLSEFLQVESQRQRQLR